MPKIEKLAEKFWYRGARKAVEAQDLVQAAVIRILRARRRFDPAKSSWGTFGMRQAYHGMQDELREQDHVPRLERARARKDGRELPEILQLDLAPLDESPMLRPDPASPAPAEIAASNDFWARIRELSDLRAGEVLERYFRHGRTLLEIGRELGMSESRTCQLLHRCLERLRKAWKEAK